MGWVRMEGGGERGVEGWGERGVVDMGWVRMEGGGERGVVDTDMGWVTMPEWRGGVREGWPEHLQTLRAGCSVCSQFLGQSSCVLRCHVCTGMFIRYVHICSSVFMVQICPWGVHGSYNYICSSVFMVQICSALFSCVHAGFGTVFCRSDFHSFSLISSCARVCLYLCV